MSVTSLLFALDDTAPVGRVNAVLGILAGMNLELDVVPGTIPGMSTELVSRPETRSQPRVEKPRLWNVVLLNDDDHTYEYVIEMMQKLFAHPVERAYQIAKRVDADNRAVCLTTHLEHAELKLEQIHGFGRDVFVSDCSGSMSALLEPADFGGEDDDDNGPHG
jgi:ATP-dependent Clp protease adaptor protein ClpS